MNSKIGVKLREVWLRNHLVEMKKVKLGDLWEESKIVSESPNSDKRIKVKLNVNGVEKRPNKNDKTGATKYFKRKAGQFIYGKQNLHKGAFGIIPNELDEHESSSDIPSFDIVEKCNPEWIYYYFKQGNFYKELEQYSKGTGSKRIHPNKIAHLEIPLPKRKEQDKIIEKIKLQENIHSKLDNEIIEQKTLLTKLKQAILQEAVQGKLVSQNPSDESAVELLKKIKKEKERLIKEGKIKKGKELPAIEEDEIPYELPKGWVWCRLGDVCKKIHYGYTASAIKNSDGIKLLRITDIQNNKVNWRQVPSCHIKESEIDKYLLRRNDILIARTGGTIGKSYLVGNIDDLKSVFASYLIRAIPLININPNYIKLFLGSNLYWSQLLEGSMGTGQPNVNGVTLSKLKFPLPPLVEQRRIVEKVDAFMEFCDELELRVGENKEGSERLMGAVLGESFGNG